MPLDNLQPRLQRAIVERVGKLAEPAADARDHTTFAQFAPFDVALGPRRPPDIGPETEHRFRWHFEPVQRARRHAKVLHLSRLQRKLRSIPGSEERPARGRDDRALRSRVTAPQRWRPSADAVPEKTSRPKH